MIMILMLFAGRKKSDSTTPQRPSRSKSGFQPEGVSLGRPGALDGGTLTWPHESRSSTVLFVAGVLKPGTSAFLGEALNRIMFDHLSIDWRDAEDARATVRAQAACALTDQGRHSSRCEWHSGMELAANDSSERQESLANWTT